MGTNYTTINHTARAELGLSWLEYGLADLIYNLSNDPKSNYHGWCYASKEYLAKSLGLSKQSVHSLLNKLLKKGLVEKEPLTKHLKVTIDWYNTVVIKESKESLLSVKQVDSHSKESLLEHSKESLHNKDIYNKDNNNTITTNVVKSSSKKNDDMAKTFKSLLEVLQASPKTILTPERRKKLKKRLNTFSVAQLKSSARAMGEDPFMAGDNPREKKYATIDYLLRNDENVDKWLNDTSGHSISNKDFEEGELLI